MHTPHDMHNTGLLSQAPTFRIKSFETLKFHVILELDLSFALLDFWQLLFIVEFIKVNAGHFAPVTFTSWQFWQ